MHPYTGTPRRPRARRRAAPARAASAALLALLLLAPLLGLAGCRDAEPEAEQPAGAAQNASGNAGGATSGNAAGLDAEAELVQVTDLTGRTVGLDAPARRVVSMLPSVTEWIIAMGAADRLVARTDYDDHPAVDTLPSVGGGLTPSIEWLAARAPDLVVAWPDAPSRSTVPRLEQVGIAVYTAPIESIDQALQAALDLGTLLDLEAEAERAVARVRAGLDEVRRDAVVRDTPDVLYLIGLDPLMAAGPGTFVTELVAAAGGRNALHDLGILWPQLSLEEVVRRAPDVVIVGSAHTPDPAALLAGRPGWREIPAVRDGRVHGVDPDVINRPGPDLHRSAAALAELIREPTLPGSPHAPASPGPPESIDGRSSMMIDAR